MNQFEIKIWYLFNAWMKNKSKRFKYYSVETIQDVRLILLHFDLDDNINEYYIANSFKNFNKDVIEVNKDNIELADSAWKFVHYNDELIAIENGDKGSCYLKLGTNKQIAIINKISDTQFDIITNINMDNKILN